MKEKTNPATGRDRCPQENRIRRADLIDDLRDGCKKMEEAVAKMIQINTFTLESKKQPS